MKNNSQLRFYSDRTLLLWLILLLGGCNNGGTSGNIQPVAKAYSWEVSLATNQPACVIPDHTLPLEVSVYDKSGALIPNPAYNVTSDIPDAIDPVGSDGWCWLLN